MSKKIAQLTQVIYILHTKNDEHEYERKSLNQFYQNEVKQVGAVVCVCVCVCVCMCVSLCVMVSGVMMFGVCVAVFVSEKMPF